MFAFLILYYRSCPEKFGIFHYRISINGVYYNLFLH